MKKLYNILFSVVVFFLFAPAIKAQEYAPEELNKQVHYNDAGGLCYSKTISKPQADGTYWITLESFVTGELTTTLGGDKPADIVLVLDASTSMAQSRGTHTDVTASLSYNDVLVNIEDNTKTNYLYKYNNSYYQLFGEKDGNNYRLYFKTPGNSNKRYLRYNDGRGTTTTQSQAAVATSADAKIVTDCSNLATGSSRIRDLQTAVVSFIDQVYLNSIKKKEEDGSYSDRVPPLQNAVSIVTFSSTNNTQTVLSLTVLTEDNLDEVKEKVNSFVLNSNTYGGQGITKANTEFASLKASNETRYNLATRTIVMFTDGEQTDNYAAVNQAYTSKHTHSATVFTVCLLDDSTRDRETVIQNMEYVSSNYPNAQSVSNPGTKVEGDVDYFYSGDDDLDIEDIFVSIADSTTGGSEGEWGSTTLSQIDVVSTDFTLPITVGQDAASLVKVYVAPFSGTYVKNGNDYETYSVIIDGESVTKKYLEFGNKELPSACLAQTLHDPFITSGGSSPTVTVNGNTISIDGFDYASNWCGEQHVVDLEGNVETTYHGHKLIILIPIKMSESSLGGPGASTNAQGSGFYKVNEDGSKTPLDINFVSPIVNLPINIRIQKTGLNKGESAKFLIQRSTTPTDDNSWEYVTSLFVTGIEGSDPVSSAIGLPATDDSNNNYVYRIVEEKWGWSYYPTTYTHRLDDGRVYLLTTDQDHNPFVFNNKPKSDIDIKVRHAESKVINTFVLGTEGGESHVDAKNNN